MITKASPQLTDKIAEVYEELKRTSLWKAQEPYWVSHYQLTPVETGADFCEWLQFIYLPNLLKQAKAPGTVYEQHYVAPQAIKFFGKDVTHGRLLRLLVELDSLS